MKHYIKVTEEKEKCQCVLCGKGIDKGTKIFKIDLIQEYEQTSKCSAFALCWDCSIELEKKMALARKESTKVKRNTEVDRTKKTNIKCENCRYWYVKNRQHAIGQLSERCTNKYSEHYMEATNYWNRCKCFDWFYKCTVCGKKTKNGMPVCDKCAKG